MDKDTIVVHTGRIPEANSGCVNTPVYRTSTILFPTLDDYHKAEKGKSFYETSKGIRSRDFCYATTGTPTTYVLQRSIAELENADYALISPSGLSAITHSLLAFLNQGDHLLVTDSVYGPTRRFCHQVLKRYGVETTFYDPMIGSDIKHLFKENTKVILTETPGSITFEVQDLPAIVKEAKNKNIIVMTDNSWATPLYYSPIEHVREGIIVLGSDGILKLYNPQYAQLWPMEASLLDKKPHLSDLLDASQDVYTFKTSKDWLKYRESVLSDLAVRSSTVRHIERIDGKVIDRVSVPLPSGDTLVSFVDVTDSALLERSLREKNEALEEADKLKTEFLANVSYELRTPLTSIVGFSQMLTLPGHDPLTYTQQDYIKSIYDSSQQLMGLINDVLDLASIEAGFMTLDKKEVDLSELVHSVTDLFLDKAEQKNVTIAFNESATKLKKIEIDERRIKQVVFNLMSNALKFTAQNGKIVIKIKQHRVEKHYETELTIEDDGVGISQEDQKKIFDRFYRAEGQKDMPQSGTGLGLAVVKNIIELHDGTVELTSSKGKGTKVVCIFKK